MGKPIFKTLLIQLCLAACLTVSACGLFTAPYKPTLLATKTLTIYPDRNFNQGHALPVDICFVTVKGNAKEITSVSPEDWFLKNKRQKYPYRQSVSVRPRNPHPIKVKLQLPADTQDLVIVANYIHLNGAKGQQLVIAAPGKPEEAIFVTDKGIYR